MKKIIGTLIIVAAGIIRALAQQDADGCKDPAMFTRMPGYHIYRCEDLQFDKFEFWISSSKSQTVEGHRLMVLYELNENTQQPSVLQVTRNYSNAVKKIGGQVVYEYEDGGVQNVVLKVTKDGKETWAHVSASGSGQCTVDIIEKQLMNQDVVADANAFSNSIKSTGKVALYGIYFDTGKSVLKPESNTTLEEIAKLIKANPSLQLYVVGHTDNVGTFDSNMKLSSDRSNAVVNALVTQHGVNAANLKAFGAGPVSPVASNDTEEGKALNRRVELVKQ